MKPTLYLLTGCTASGKTEVALDWALRLGAEIVSCDSLLFYRGMDIGTAKPTVAERARGRHHLIDILEPRERMDVKTYSKLAREAVREIEARGRSVLVVGGSGFYLKSFFASVADDVAIDPALRADLERQWREFGLGALVERLAALNPHDLGTLDTKNPRRVLRALERCLASGQTLQELATAFRDTAPPFPEHELKLVEVARNLDELKTRIRERAGAMVAAGLIDEVRALRRAGFETNPTTAGAIGYRETLAWLDGDGTSTHDLVEAITHATWRLVRKQRTWFRSQLPPHRTVMFDTHSAPDLDALFG